ncbi:hypothetical protein TanjilG_00200 [Lupinus angustifolius]|uniref:Uncharacterized protein n=1 Tax=Lupinus angustifolius TaxID=3871 RepID=A0A394DCL4_LUPAN|nr:hypothetical protein TanjilG_00200 [Lupinus angustifolius]
MIPERRRYCKWSSQSNPKEEHHSSDTSNSKLVKMHVMDEGTSNGTLDVDMLKDYIQALLKAHLENIMDRFKQDKDCLNEGLEIMEIVIDSGFDDIHTRL